MASKWYQSNYEYIKITLVYIQVLSTWSWYRKTLHKMWLAQNLCTLTLCYFIYLYFLFVGILLAYPSVKRLLACKSMGKGHCVRPTPTHTHTYMQRGCFSRVSLASVFIFGFCIQFSISLLSHRINQNHDDFFSVLLK